MSRPSKKTREQLELEVKELEELLKYKEGLPHLLGQKFYPWSRRVWESTKREIFLCSANQVGKQLNVDCLLPTPQGFRAIGDLAIGDFVFGRDGWPTKVVAIPYEGSDPLYRFTFNDGTSIDAGGEHLWICKGFRQRFRKKYARSQRSLPNYGKENAEYGKWVVRSTKEIIAFGGYCPGTTYSRRFVIPLSEPVEYSGKDLFDPYYVGLWVGNGSTGSITFHGDDLDLAEYAQKYGNQRSRKAGTNTVAVGVNAETMKRLSVFGSASFNKSIPQNYLRGSVEQRKSLLSGLMDTDGSCERDGKRNTYCTVSPELSKAFEELVCSLGGMCETRKKQAGYKKNGEFIRCRDAYETTVWLPFNPYRSTRKAAKWKLDGRYKFERVIVKIEPIKKANSRCITVDNEDGSFLATENYIVTHNSSIAIRKNIRLATDPSLWPKFWPGLAKGQVPNLFFYFYPTMPSANTEFETKWVPQFLPRGEFRKHPLYGWESETEKGLISKIRFNTGVQIQFKSYSMKVKDLQTASVYHITADEELPTEYLPEIAARTNATDGHLLMVFTATLGQLHWLQTMEPATKSEEKHPDALKIQVSLFDSQFFDDGTPSPWTAEKIKRAIANCPTEAEVQRRVYGRFVKASGLAYEAFSHTRNMCDPHPIPKDWAIWGGVDPGSGGQSGHPTGMVLIATSPDFKQGRVFRAWRGDNIPTTSSDIVEQFRELKKGYTTTYQTYDFAAADFFTVAARMGEPFSPANKKRESGIALLNTLFKTGILKIFRGDPELEKLVTELCTLGVTQAKQTAQDDLIDPTRYVVQAIPWNFDGIEDTISVDKQLEAEKLPVRQKSEPENRREWFMGPGQEIDPDQSFHEEFDFWNDLSGASESDY